MFHSLLQPQIRTNLLKFHLPDIVFICCHSVDCKSLFCGYSVVFVWYLNPDINQFVDLTATSTKFPPPPLFYEAPTRQHQHPSRPHWWFVPSDVITRWLEIIGLTGGIQAVLFEKLQLGELRLIKQIKPGNPEAVSFEYKASTW